MAAAQVSVSLFSILSVDDATKIEEYIDDKALGYRVAHNSSPLGQGDIDKLKEDVLASPLKKMLELKVHKIAEQVGKQMQLKQISLSAEEIQAIKSSLSSELTTFLATSVQDRSVLISKRDLISKDEDTAETDTVDFFFSDQATHTKILHKVDLRADANKLADANGNTWLHLASTAGHERMLEGFIKLGGKGLNLDPVNQEGLTPLMTGMLAGKQKAVEILATAGANRNAVRRKDQKEASVLHIGAIECHPQILEAVLKHGAGTLNLEVLCDSVTPLYKALREGKKESAELLIEAGADIFFQFGCNMLHAASIGGDIEHLKYLLQKGVKVQNGSGAYVASRYPLVIKTIENANPLFFAAKQDNVEILRCLVAAGDDPHRIYTDKTNVVHFAMQRKHDPQVLRYLLEECKVNPNQVDEDGRTPIMDHPTLEELTLLLQNGANPNVLDADKCTPLMKECKKTGDPRKVILLLKYGANHELGGEPFMQFVKDDGLLPTMTSEEQAVEITKLFHAKGALLGYSRMDDLQRNGAKFPALIKYLHNRSCTLL